LQRKGFKEQSSSDQLLRGAAFNGITSEKVNRGIANAAGGHNHKDYN
jgi:hypothetical protein